MVWCMATWYVVTVCDNLLIIRFHLEILQMLLCLSSSLHLKRCSLLAAPTILCDPLIGENRWRFDTRIVDIVRDTRHSTITVYLQFFVWAIGRLCWKVSILGSLAMRLENISEIIYVMIGKQNRCIVARCQAAKFGWILKGFKAFNNHK